MKTKKIQELINAYEYWDMRVTKLECNYFGDEIILVYNDDNGHNVIYNFTKCYKSIFEHVKSYDKLIPTKEMEIGQVPYFIQDVEITDVVEEDVCFFVCKINMFPLNLEIWSKEIEVYRKKK